MQMVVSVAVRLHKCKGLFFSYQFSNYVTLTLNVSIFCQNRGNSLLETKALKSWLKSNLKCLKPRNSSVSCVKNG